MKIPDTSGIYKITTPSGKFYIGSAVNFRRRRNGHRTRLNQGRHHCPGLQHAFNKYGPDALVFEIVELVPRAQLLEREQFYLDSLWPKLYNCARVAGSGLGTQISVAARQKISKALKGIKRSPETRARMSAAQAGRKMSTQACINISRAQMGRRQSKATAAKRAESLRGRAHKDNSTGFPGVGPFRGRFRARWLNKHIGVFDTAELAYAAVEKARNG